MRLRTGHKSWCNQLNKFPTAFCIWGPAAKIIPSRTGSEKYQIQTTSSASESTDERCRHPVQQEESGYTKAHSRCQHPVRWRERCYTNSKIRCGGSNRFRWRHARSEGADTTPVSDSRQTDCPQTQTARKHQWRVPRLAVDQVTLRLVEWHKYNLSQQLWKLQHCFSWSLAWSSVTLSCNHTSCSPQGNAMFKQFASNFTLTTTTDVDPAEQPAEQHIPQSQIANVERFIDRFHGIGNVHYCFGMYWCPL